MASLAKLAEKLKQEKQQAAKLRRQTENKLKAAVSLGRRSSSGLSSLERRIEDSKEKLDEINAEFNQILSRKESIERLIKAAQERLTVETQLKDQAETDLANADSDAAKQTASERVAQINEKIGELESEIKQRESAAQKLVKIIEGFKKSKTKTSHQLQKQTKTKPSLVTLIKKSHVDSEKLKKQFEIASKKENAVSKSLTKVTEKLEQMLAKKRKAAAKKAALKRAAKKKSLARKKVAAKRKTAAKKARKKPAKKAAPKKSKKKSRR